MKSRTHIVIAEPSIIIRSGLAAVLKRMTGLNIDVAELSELGTLSASLGRLRPDILIIDPSHLGVFSLQHIKSEAGCTHLKTIALQNTLVDASSLKHYDETILVYDSAERIQSKLRSLIQADAPDEARQELSEREKDVVVCVVKGLTNKQIADKLCLSAHTVMAHRRNIAGKLQIHSTSGLTIYAIVNKLVDINDVD